MDRILNKRTLLVFGTVSATLFASLGILFYFVEISVFRAIFNGLVLVFAGFMILYFGKNQTRIRFEQKQVLLAALLGWLLISCIANTLSHNVDYVYHHIEALLDTAVIAFLVFPLGSILAREGRIPKVIRFIPHFVLLGWSAFLVAVLVVIFQGNTIPTLNGGTIGMRNYQFLHLNCYYNTTGMWEVVFAPACFYMMMRCKPAGLKAVYGIATLVNLAVLFLSNSRTATYSVMIGMSVMGGIGGYSLLGKRKELQRILCGIGIALLTGLALYLMRKGTFELYWQATKSISGNGDSTITGTIRDLSDSTVATFTGRTKIWECSIKGIFLSWQNAIFGVTPAGVIPMLEEISNGAWDVYTHNQFLEIGVANGLVGAGIFIWWFVLVLRDIWRMYFIQKEKTVLLCIPVMILTLGLANFFESTLLYYGFISSYAFFFLCGILHGKTNAPATVPTENRSLRRQKARKTVPVGK